MILLLIYFHYFFYVFWGWNLNIWFWWPCCIFILSYWCHNVQVRGGQLWGTDIYTDDSDLVAGMWWDDSICIFYINHWSGMWKLILKFISVPVLMHTGYCRPTASPPPPAILELRATIRVLPPQDCKSMFNSILLSCVSEWLTTHTVGTVIHWSLTLLN